ncbi:hypothetical protein [Saccharopolyspora pogona]|uniref:hypothetical protein n=1 Tax=Saccharopolyspora pogona TaxID=333966 RepID=UPI001CC25B60|nr:hypothetical protein [Saccharopolyspora pogona]
MHGVDLARVLAVLGMFVTHIGPAALMPSAGTAAAVLAGLSDGHASILFVTLAGLSLGLLTGGRTPHGGVALRRDRVRIAVRAVILFVLGMGLTLGAPIMVILSFYAVYVVLALPVLRVSPGVLASGARRGVGASRATGLVPPPQPGRESGKRGATEPAGSAPSGLRPWRGQAAGSPAGWAGSGWAVRAGRRVKKAMTRPANTKPAERRKAVL